MRYLGHKCRRADCENMIWEVDENNDGGVDWEEFKIMHAASPLQHAGRPRLVTRLLSLQVLPRQG